MNRRHLLLGALGATCATPTHAEARLGWTDIVSRENGLRAYANAASGPWRVAVAPGAPCEPRFFAKVLEGLSPDIAALALERPGYGANAEGPVLDLERQARALLAAAHPRGEPRKRVILLGHSFGAPIAAYAAALEPRAIDGLVIVSPFFVPMAANVLGLIDTASRLFEGSEIFTPRLRIARAEVAAHAHFMERLTPKIDRIRAPTILIHDRQDGVTPPNNAQWLIDRLSSDHLVDVIWTDGAGHETPANAPEAIIAAVKQLTAA
jgi:pimeloyl-ACP methyl ester carboxylesterase